MSNRCGCGNHPEGCYFIALMSMIGLIGTGCALGWRWVFLFLLVSSEIDWLIRVWKHRAA